MTQIMIQIKIKENHNVKKYIILITIISCKHEQNIKDFFDYKKIHAKILIHQAKKETLIGWHLRDTLTVCTI